MDTSKTCHAYQRFFLLILSKVRFCHFSDGDESSELDSAEERKWQKLKANARQLLENAKDSVAGADMESE